MPRVPKPTCCVCFEKFNKTTQSPTTCPHCQIQICRTCFQTYLLGDMSDVPRCVNVECNRGWERNFLDGEMTSTFRLKTYKEHREKILSDREKSRLPATQEDAAAIRQAKAAKPILEAHLEKARELARKVNQQLDTAYRACFNVDRVIASYGRERIPAPTVAGQGAAPAPAPKPKVVVAFVKPCPAEGCKGFLSTAWKCGLCDLYTCPDCHDLKGAVREDPSHRCDPDKVASATLLNREARNCPKCGVSICKIEGCDQMWCTQCNTGFNWRTGKVAEGPVHNPHYFEWLRSQGRDPNAAAAPGQNACAVNQDREISQAIYGSATGYLYTPYNNRRNPSERTNLYLGEAWRLAREGDDLARVETADTEEKLRVFRVR